ncbi:class I SAM-dependent methyltransferase [Embleya sp. NPDC050493]|uniref:class I SAM-dependent methyltransferase n=1 Tax=Embleya sp. NPDC050493 TaxID=3363989 RepID=UPI0037B4D0E7
MSADHDLLRVREVLEALPGVAAAEVFRIAHGPVAAVAALVRGHHPPDPTTPGTPAPSPPYTGPDVTPAIAALDRAAVLAMAHTLHGAGLFTPGNTHTATEICERLRVPERHRWIIRRWLTALTEHDLLAAVPAQARYGPLRAVTRAELGVAMVGLDAARRELGYPPAMGRFLQTTLRALPALVSGQRTVQASLFEGGATDTATGNYRDNVISRHVNAVAATAVAHAAGRAAGRPRVLEIGAGVGATTESVLSELGSVDYLFTDVSSFFLDAGRRRFAGRPGLRYTLVDINAPRSSRLAAEPPFDVILAANVLHNARHATRGLALLRELLAPDGTLVFLESCREHAVLSTGMQFLMSARADDPVPGFADFRAGGDRIFPTVGEWTTSLHAAGFDHVAVDPGPGDPLAAAGQHVFTARPREPSRPRPDPGAVRAAAADLLPTALAPIEVHAVDALAPSTVPAP